MRELSQLEKSAYGHNLLTDVGLQDKNTTLYLALAHLSKIIKIFNTFFVSKVNQGIFDIDLVLGDMDHHPKASKESDAYYTYSPTCKMLSSIFTGTNTYTANFFSTT